MWFTLVLYSALCSGWTEPFVYCICINAVRSAHSIFATKRRQRPSTCSMWYAITSVVTGGTDRTTGQHQFIGLQWTRWTNSTGHTWTGHWPLQCPVWIRSGEDQQEQRVYLFNCCSTKTQTSLPVHRKSRRDYSCKRRFYLLSSQLPHFLYWFVIPSYTIILQFHLYEVQEVALSCQCN